MSKRSAELVMPGYNELIAAKEAEIARLQKMADLAHQQMNDWWDMIQQRESIIQSILGASDQAIFTLDEYGKILDCNDLSANYFAVPLQFAKGSSIFDVLIGEEVLSDLKSILDLKNPSAAESILGQRLHRVLRRTNGANTPVNVLYSKVISKKGIIFPIFIHDLSAELQSALVLEEARAQVAASAKMAALGEMAGGIAHEINTPLNIFTLSADMLRDAVLEPEIDRLSIFESADMIERTAQRISKIILGLRAFSRDDNNEGVEAVDVSAAIADTLSLCGEKMTVLGVTIEVLPCTESCPKVLARTIGLSQVLLNLINNARDAVENQPSPWIRIQAETTETHVIISVTDCGPGIPEELREKIMQPFFTTKDIGRGTGLGLSISKGIIEKFEGELRYNPDSPNTQFQIRLRLAPNEGVES